MASRDWGLIGNTFDWDMPTRVGIGVDGVLETFGVEMVFFWLCQVG